MANEHKTAELKPLIEAYITAYQAHKREAIFEQMKAIIKQIRFKDNKKAEMREKYNRFTKVLFAYTIDMVGKPEHEELRTAINPEKNLFLFAIERNSLHPRGKITFDEGAEW